MPKTRGLYAHWGVVGVRVHLLFLETMHGMKNGSMELLRRSTFQSFPVMPPRYNSSHVLEFVSIQAQPKSPTSGNVPHLVAITMHSKRFGPKLLSTSTRIS
jgi:hypothetical protein